MVVTEQSSTLGEYACAVTDDMVLYSTLCLGYTVLRKMSTVKEHISWYVPYFLKTTSR